MGALPQARPAQRRQPWGQSGTLFQSLCPLASLIFPYSALHVVPLVTQVPPYSSLRCTAAPSPCTNTQPISGSCSTQLYLHSQPALHYRDSSESSL